MDRKKIEDEHIVARYLADQLTPEESEAFEAYYTQHPGMVREIEYSLRLKEGLATLRDRQHLDALMRAPGRRWAVPLSIAAALIVAIAGLWTWRGINALSPVAASLDGLVAESTSPLPLGGKYLLVRMRGDRAELQIPMPAERSAIELQVLPGAGASGAPYQLTVSRLEADGSSRPVGQIAGLTPGSDGLVTAWVDSASLQPGRHAVELAAERADSTTPADRFVIELE